MSRQDLWLDYQYYLEACREVFGHEWHCTFKEYVEWDTLV